MICTGVPFFATVLFRTGAWVRLGQRGWGGTRLINPPALTSESLKTGASSKSQLVPERSTASTRRRKNKTVQKGAVAELTAESQALKAKQRGVQGVTQAGPHESLIVLNGVCFKRKAPSVTALCF